MTNGFKLSSVSIKSFYVGHDACVWGSQWRICHLPVCVNNSDVTDHLNEALSYHNHARLVYVRTDCSSNEYQHLELLVRRVVYPTHERPNFCSFTEGEELNDICMDYATYSREKVCKFQIKPNQMNQLMTTPIVHFNTCPMPDCILKD